MPFEPSKKFWQSDSCLVCQSVHSSSFEKIQHEGEVLHQKKVIVYEFLKKQLPSLGKVNPESQDALSSKLYERYIRSGAPIIGLDCIFELSVHWASTPLWICKICYASGKDLESADAHLFSSFHKRNYLREKYPERFVSLVRVQDKSEVHKHTAIEHEAALDVLHGSKGISNPPQLYVLGINKWDQEQVMQDLALDKDIYELSYVIEPVTSKHQIMSCHICGENVMSFMDEEERIKLWNIHCSTPKHQRYQLIHSAIAEVRTIERNEQPRNFSVSHEINFNEENGIFYGPTCGLEFLTTFENECFCKLCCCIVPIEEASKHFRSESHIGIFLLNQKGENMPGQEKV
uniref:C2H2-type domain-containing protein n=1 Tax=Acrobeloides nanus TaxID=290746 RepID=A0A914CEQ9_9BILA